MINVLHLRDTDRVCGPGKTIIETACASDARYFSQKIGLFLLPSETRNLYHDAAVSRGVEVIPVRSAHPYDPRVVLTLAGIVKTHRIDIVHSHEYKSDLVAWLLARTSPVPIMSTVHGWITNSSKSRAVVGLSQRALRGFGRVAAVSDETRRKVLACGVSSERVVVLHNAVVTANYNRDRQPRGFLRSRFDLPPGARIVGNVGRLSPEKGQADFLLGAAAIAASHPDAYFVLVGDGPSRAALERQSVELGLGGRVRFTGHLSDVRPAYRDLDVLALTSHTEGFPNVVLEAMCMDVPVLATAVGGTGEVVEDGVTGVLIGAGQPAAIATGLDRLLRDPDGANALAAAGKRRVEREFSFDRRVSREENVYRELLAEWQVRHGKAAVHA